MKAEAEDMNMTAGQMLTEVMKFLIKDMLETRKKIIHSDEELPGQGLKN